MLEAKCNFPISIVIFQKEHRKSVNELVEDWCVYDKRDLGEKPAEQTQSE